MLARNILRRTSQIGHGDITLHGLRQRHRAVRSRVDSLEGGGFKFIAPRNRAADSNNRDTLSLCPHKYALRSLAHQCLAINAPLAREDHIAVGDNIVEALPIQYQLNTAHEARTK